MKTIRVPHFGIFIQKTSIELKEIPRSTLLQVMETQEPYDENEYLISFSPHFGEAIDVFIRRLEQLGLKYGVDFYDFRDNPPG